MLSRFVVWLTFAAATLVVSAGVVAWSGTAAEVRLSVETLHAAQLTTSRGAGDSTDSPFLLVSIVGRKGMGNSLELPPRGHFTIHSDEALGARPLTSIHLQPGDTIRVLISVLEDENVLAADESRARVASAKAIGSRASAVVAALVPLTKRGAHWLGSAELVLTNEKGLTLWRSLECVATCKVLTAPVGNAARTRGVVELSGDGGTYHLQLTSQRS